MTSSPVRRSAALPVLLLVSVLLPAGPAAATPLVDISWDACTPIVTAKQPAPGVTTVELFVSVTGMGEAHKGYAVQVAFGPELPCRQAGPPVPDAWRFDPAGCQATLGQVFFTDASPSCPPLRSTVGPVFTILEIQKNTQSSYSPGTMRAICVVAYPQGAWTPDPAQRYLLMKVRFDLQYAVAGPGEPDVTCGGLESPMCFALWEGYQTMAGNCWFPAGTEMVYVGTDDVQYFMQAGVSYATFGLAPGSAMSCFEGTPARPTTWGDVKARYRD